MVGEVASVFVVLHDLVVEDGEVQGKAKLDGVAGGKGDVVGFFVGLESVRLDLLKKGTFGVFGDVTIVVSYHLDEEGLGFTVTLLLEHFGADHVNNLLAVTSEFGLDALFVAGKSLGVLRVLGVLLDCCNCAACGALRADQVLESDGEKVALIRGHIGTLGVQDECQEVDHVLEAFCLLCNTCQKYVLLD